MREEINTVPVPQVSKNMQFLKNVNRGAVIKALALRKVSNRSELAELLKLSKMSISNIIGDLKQENLITEINDTLPNSARNVKRLLIREWSLNAVCVCIQRTTISFMLMDINGSSRLLNHCVIPADADNSYLQTILETEIQKIIDVSPGLTILGIGISAIGPLDIYKKCILNPPDFRKISDFNIGDFLETRFHMPVFIDNDMNCSSLAELFWGKGKSHRDFVFAGFSSGVGAGIIMNEKIIHGFGGFAGEIGHIPYDPHGPKCSCGQRGCIELYVSGKNILKNMGVRTFEELNHLLELPDPPGYITNCVKQYLSVMKNLMVLIANCYDPDIIILGNADKTFTTKYISEIEQHMNRHMLNQGYKYIPIVFSDLNEMAGLYGAGAIVFQHVFDGNIMAAIE